MYLKEEKKFVEKEIKQLLENDIIEECISPWRSQVVVEKGKDKRRLWIDYSQSVNQCTKLDAFPLPRINDLINDLSKYRYLSKFDLRSAYYQIPLHPHDMKLTAFEANGRLFHFQRIPFGLTNAVEAFQRIITQIVNEDALVGTYPYLDDVTVAGDSMEKLEERFRKFEEALKKRCMTLNENKKIKGV